MLCYFAEMWRRSGVVDNSYQPRNSDLSPLELGPGGLKLASLSRLGPYMLVIKNTYISILYDTASPLLSSKGEILVGTNKTKDIKCGTHILQNVQIIPSSSLPDCA